MAKNTIGTLHVRLQANPKGFKRGMRDAQKSVTNFRGSMEKVSKSLDLIVGGGAIAVATQAARMFAQSAAMVKRLSDEYRAGTTSASEFAEGMLGQIPIFGDWFKFGTELRGAMGSLWETMKEGIGIQNEFASAFQRGGAAMAELTKQGEVQAAMLDKLERVRRKTTLGGLKGHRRAGAAAGFAFKGEMKALDEMRRQAQQDLTGSAREFQLREIAEAQAALTDQHQKYLRSLKEARKIEFDDRREKTLIARMKAEEKYRAEVLKTAAAAAAQREKAVSEINEQIEEVRQKMAEARTPEVRPFEATARAIHRGSAGVFQAQRARGVQMLRGRDQESLRVQRDQLMALRAIERGLKFDLQQIEAA